MRITEIIQSKPSSTMTESVIQDVVPQDVVSDNRVSAIAEGISQILRRVKGKGLKPGFRCLAGPRKGRIVVNPSTCTAKLQPQKGAKIRQKRQARARATGLKRSRTMRSGGASRRLKTIQVGKRDRGKSIANPKKGRSLKKGKGLQKSKVLKPRK
jgi:hypothetical protein